MGKQRKQLKINSSDKVVVVINRFKIGIALVDCRYCPVEYLQEFWPQGQPLPRFKGQAMIECKIHGKTQEELIISERKLLSMTQETCKKFGIPFEISLGYD